MAALPEELSPLGQDPSPTELTEWMAKANQQLCELQQATLAEQSDEALTAQIEQRVQLLEPQIAAYRTQLKALKQQEQGSQGEAQSSASQIDALQRRLESSQLAADRWQRLADEREEEQLPPSSRVEAAQATQKEMAVELLDLQNSLIGAKRDKVAKQKIQLELTALEARMDQNLALLKQWQADAAARAAEDVSPRTALQRVRQERQEVSEQLQRLQGVQPEQADKEAATAAALQAAQQQPKQTDEEALQQPEAAPAEAENPSTTEDEPADEPGAAAPTPPSKFEQYMQHRGQANQCRLLAEREAKGDIDLQAKAEEIRCTEKQLFYQPHPLDSGEVPPAMSMLHAMLKDAEGAQGVQGEGAEGPSPGQFADQVHNVLALTMIKSK